MWLLIFSAAFVVFGFAIYGSIFFTLPQVIAVAAASLTAIVVSRHQPRITDTGITFTTKNIFVFWAAVWTGVAGAVLVGLSISIAEAVRARDKRRALFSLAAEGVATLLAASVYHIAAGFVIGGQSGSTNFGSRVLAIVLMASAHFLLTSAFTYLYLALETARSVRRILSESIANPAPSYAATTVTVLVLDYVFEQFGIKFGLVLIPIVVLGSVAYSVHLGMLSRKTREIYEASRIHLATVEALATAIDARDQVGVGHVRRTQIYAIGLGQLLGLPEKEINALRTAALLHDIGKLAVPDHILNKSERLTTAEMEKTKIHSSVGASILEKVNFGYPVVPAVRYHHENWDGSGYPEGLRGENIPLTARILAIADAYDTLRCDRPYRPAYSRDEARRQVMADGGRKFDPVLVNLFFSNLGTFESEISANGLNYRTDSLDRTRFSDSFVEQIKLANREVFTLYELAREFSGSLDLSDTYSMFTDKIRDFVPFDTCVIYLMDEVARTADAVYAEGDHKSHFVGDSVRPGEGLTGRALEARELFTASVLESDRAIDDDDCCQRFGYTAAVSLPLVTDQKIVGAVTLYSSAVSKYGEEHLRLLETVSKIASDAIAKSREHAEAERSALTDPMTGLPNARSLRRQFEKEAARSRRAGTSFQVLMLDLDGFKQVNDTLGHKAGDMMLAEISKVIAAQLREYDFLARYAGDEFVAIVPGTTSADVFDLCRRIETAVREFVLRVDDAEARVGVSVGSASFPHSGESFDQLLIAADKKMYTTKTSRKKAKKTPAVSKTKYAPVPKPDDPLPASEQAIADEHVSIVEDDETPPTGDAHIVSSAVN